MIRNAIYEGDMNDSVTYSSIYSIYIKKNLIIAYINQ